MLPARDNPFEADRVERLLRFEPEWLGLSWEQILGRVQACGYRGAIVGPHGSGKTTFCDAFAAKLEADGLAVVRWFFNDRKDSPDPAEIDALGPPNDPKPTILLADGIENVAPAAWRPVASRIESLAGCFVTTHEARRQPKPRLPVFLNTDTRVEMLIDFTARLAPDHPFAETELRQIFDDTRGNLREALWVCYDRVTASG